MCQENMMIEKVIKIPNSKTLIISRQDSHDISEGDKAIVYEPSSDIVDLETKEILGSFDFTKATLTVDEVHDSYIICSKKTITNAGPFAMNIAALFPREEVQNHELPVNPRQNEKIDLEHRPISIGDLVKIEKQV